MTSNDKDNNQPKPSAELAAIEKYLKYLDIEIQKLENAARDRDDKIINFMSQLEHELKSLWQRVMQFIENELTANNNWSIKNEQKIAVLEQRYSKFTDSYLNYLDKINDTALSVLKITLPITPALFAINVQTQWFNIAWLLWGFVAVFICTIVTVAYIGFSRKNYISVEGKRVLDEIDITKQESQEFIAKADAKNQCANELINRINTSLGKVELLKKAPSKPNSQE